MILVFVLFGVTHTPDGPFRRPHPAFWRLILCLSIVYELALVFLLFQVRAPLLPSDAPPSQWQPRQEARLDPPASSNDHIPHSSYLSSARVLVLHYLPAYSPPLQMPCRHPLSSTPGKPVGQSHTSGWLPDTV